MKDAKFEVEIELQNDEVKDRASSFNMIKMFQWDSESSGSDSYRINVEKALKNKKRSQKVARGRKLTTDDEDYFGINRRESMKQKSSKNIEKLNNPDIIEEEEDDEDKFGLDYLEDYRKDMKQGPITTNKTNTTMEGDLIQSPISKGSLKRISVKNITRRQSIGTRSSFKKKKVSHNNGKLQVVEID